MDSVVIRVWEQNGPDCACLAVIRPGSSGPNVSGRDAKAPAMQHLLGAF